MAAVGREPDPSASPSPSPSASDGAATDDEPAAAQASQVVELLGYGSDGYRYQQVPHGGGDPQWMLMPFEDDTWPVGSGAFGSAGACAISSDVRTAWATNTDLLVRHDIWLPSGATDVVISIAIDNDAEVWWNGELVATPAHENCATYDSFQLPVSNDRVFRGLNVLAVRGIDRGNQSFLDIRVTGMPADSCDFEQLTTTDQVPGRVQVAYDPSILWNADDPAFEERARAMAQAIEQRAEDDLDEFETLGFAPLPSLVTFQILCHPKALGVFELPEFAPAIVEGADTVKVKADFVRRTLAPRILAISLGQAVPAVPGTEWANVVDHELVHTFQYAAAGSAQELWLRAQFEWDYGILEGTATLGQDLLPDTDDTVTPAMRGSFLDYVSNRFMTDLPAADPYENDGQTPYGVAGWYQWLAEQYGEAALADQLEKRAAAFSAELYTSRKPHLAGVAQATGVGSVGRVLDALRDFYVAALVREAPNKAALPARFRIYDEYTGHGAARGTLGTGLQSWGQVPTIVRALPASGTLTVGPGIDGEAAVAATAGHIYDLTLPPGATVVHVTVADGTAEPGLTPPSIDPLRLAFAGITGNGEVALDPALFRNGPGFRRELAFDVPVQGLARLDLVALAGRSANRYQMTFEVTGVDGLTIDPIPDVRSTDARGGVLAFAHPSWQGQPVRLPRTAFQATIDGAQAQVTAAIDLKDSQELIVTPAADLTAGTHQLVLSAGSASVQGTFNVTSGGGPLAPTATASGALRSVIEVAGGPTAGMPLEVRYALTDGGTGFPGAAVAATVTSPSGATRTIPLEDVGNEPDGAAGDGGYGALVFGTDEAGIYSVTVTATGTGSDGPFNLSETATLALGTKVDGDGDGIADAVEPWFSLDPADAGDGGLDLDGDGLGTAIELSAGLDPVNADSDGGGEADASEVAAGRLGWDPTDDRSVPDVAVAARARDGNLVEVTVAASDPSATVHLYRVAGGSRTDLGVQPGSGVTLTDGPLATGPYTYLAIPEASTGAIGVPVESARVEVRPDATPPAVRIVLAGDHPVTNDPNLQVTFLDLTEPVVEMRIAESPEALAAASWQPFQALASVSLTGDGLHEVYAQVRDAAGGASPVAQAAILLDTAHPASSVGSIPATTSEPAIEVPFTASDEATGVASVELWARHRASPSDAWGAWAIAATATASPVSIGFSSGDGEYELYTVAVDGAGNREAPPATADATIQRLPAITTGSVTRVFSFAAGLDGWTGSGANCTSQHAATDGTPPGSLATTVSGKNKTALCLWRSPVATWQSWGVPAGAIVVAARLESAATRIAACTACGSGQINGYRLETGPGETVATVWTGRTLPAGQEPWQNSGAHPDQEIGSSWRGANSQIRLTLDATLKTGNPGSSTVTLRQDEITLVITYQLGGDAPPDYSVGLLAADGPVCPAGQVCTDGLETVTLTAGGTATASTGPVGVAWRLYGVASDGTITQPTPFSSAIPIDGLFDETIEDFEIVDARPDVGYAAYDVEIRATAAGVSTTRTYRVVISRCDPGQC